MDFTLSGGIRFRTYESKNPARIILNFETKEVKVEFERIKAIEGTQVIKEPYQMGSAWIATMADPDGNYFQLDPLGK